MNDALDRREENGRPGRLDQVVFRWDGNQGRSNAGMAAVAHSCSAERAEALRRELGPLLWVPGSGPAPRPSSVRVPSRACGTVLLQRWPTLDLGGRPSTACHAVFGDTDTLTPLLCLGLSGRAWSTPEAAESAVGGLPPLDGDRLRATAAARLREMTQDLPTVKKPLMVVVAEWLREPSRRLSLLAEEHELPGWPRRNSAPLLYLGLLSVFGDWFGTEWSYATYDTVDTHDVRLTCVPGWSSQAAGARSLARVRLRLPAEGDLEMSAAKELVEYVLDHPGADPGVPHLAGDLRLGAGLPRQERRDALRRMLNTWLAPAPSLPPAPAPRPEGEEAWGREPERERDRERGRHAQDRDREHERELREQRWEREPHDRQREREPREQQDRERDRERERELREQQQDRERERYERERRERELRRLRDELLVHQRVNAAQTARLAARLMDLRDSSLLSLLRADELPWVSRDLVLAELARPDRRRSRDEATAHALCAEVLRHNLYFRPGRSEADGPSAAEMREHAADLFHWAVAPLAREPHHAPDLRPLFNVFLKDGRNTGMEWLRRVLVAPPGGRAPDLPPQLWQQVVTELLARPGAVPAPTTPPSPLVAASVAGPPAAPSPRTAPEPAVRTATPLSSTPPRPVRPATTDPAPRGDEPEKQGLLYRDSFLAAFAGVVGAIVIGILVLIIVN
ncbi:hypothetical protein [Streptomyces sp. NPDC006267]|uniref:hypothetical protein n=1 Tax=Streptomyces sp. NPDC006267 TaxID=3157173 RepID=UPI0033B3BB80